MRNHFKEDIGKCVNNSLTPRRRHFNEGVIENLSYRLNENSNLISQIYALARERDISIKMFEVLANKQYNSKVEKITFDAGCLILIRAIKSYDLPRFIKNEKHLQRMISGNFFLKRGETGFDDFANQKNVKYGGIVYVIKPIKPFCIHSSVLEEIYIGVTWKTLIERFIEHTEDAINVYIVEHDIPNRLIERLIIRATLLNF